MIGIVGLYALPIGAAHLAYAAWFPFFQPPAVEIYNMLQAGFGGASFKAMAIVALVFGGFAFFARLICPHHKAD